MSQESSKELAKTWPHKRHNVFVKELRYAAEKWFTSKNMNTHPKMPYCLTSLKDWQSNIICPKVVDYINNEKKNSFGKDAFPLHKYLHHGLSSQAMLFNLIGPLITRGDLSPLQVIVESKGIRWPNKAKATFEYDDRKVFNEDSGQPTSIDLVISEKIFIEAKLVEQEFGGCSVF